METKDETTASIALRLIEGLGESYSDNELYDTLLIKEGDSEKTMLAKNLLVAMAVMVNKHNQGATNLQLGLSSVMDTLREITHQEPKRLDDEQIETNKYLELANQTT